MSLTDKAHDFIQYGSGSKRLDQLAILRDCMEAGTLDALQAVQLMFEDMYGGYTYNYELKAPAAFCLVRWGVQGLDALVGAANRTPRLKNNSFVIEILATLAACEKLPQAGRWITDELVKLLLSLVADWDQLYSEARRRLGTYILSFEDEQDVVLAIGTQFTNAATLSSSGVARSLVAALAVRWLAVSLPTIEEFENILRDHPDDEPRLQSFLEKHPQLVDPMAFEVWPRPRIHGAKEPDFIIRRTDDTYLVVEIETPGKSLVTAANKISAETTHAVSQVTDYADFLAERLLSVRQNLPTFRQPDCLVIVGMEGGLNDDQVRALKLDNDSRHRVKIVGFDWIAKRARSIVNNVVAQEIKVIRDLRIV